MLSVREDHHVKALLKRPAASVVEEEEDVGIPFLAGSGSARDLSKVLGRACSAL